MLQPRKKAANVIGERPENRIQHWIQFFSVFAYDIGYSFFGRSPMRLDTVFFVRGCNIGYGFFGVRI